MLDRIPFAVGGTEIDIRNVQDVSKILGQVSVLISPTPRQEKSFILTLILLMWRIR
jgi:hypothetical protein